MPRQVADLSFSLLGGRSQTQLSGAPSASPSPEDSDHHYKFYTEGTHRSCPPEETLARVQEYFPLFGITRIANVTGLDVIGIPVVMVVRPNSQSLSVSQGKGTSLISAKISGVMESIEGWHAETIDAPVAILSHDKLLAHHTCVDIERVSLNRDKPFRFDAKIPWTMGRDIMDDREIWLPYEIVHTNYTHPATFDNGYFISDTNGLASGNCLIEAVNHGLCEVIERDALTLWSLKSKTDRNQTRVALESVDDPHCLGLIEKFIRKGIDVAVWDITSDVGIPAYACKIMQTRREDGGIRPAMGAGCHPSKNIALSRALTEAAQSRLTFISGARDDQLRKTYEKFQSDDSRTHWIAEMREDHGSARFSDRENYKSAYLEEDNKWILDRLKKADLQQVVVVDLTKPEFGISVVKIVVPGLECHTVPEKRTPGKRAMEVISRRKSMGENAERR